MKTLSGKWLLAALIAVAGPALSSPKIDEIVVTAKKPAAVLMTDMTDEILAETSADLRASQPALAAPDVHVDLPALNVPSGT